MDEVTRVNHEALAAPLKLLANKYLAHRACPRILLLSPSDFDLKLAEKYFPTGDFYISDYWLWNLDSPFPSGPVRLDLVIASNVFMYSKRPLSWFSNIFSVSDFVLIQDLISRKRSGDYPYLGRDGDSVRYEFLSRNVNSDCPAAFNLDALEENCLFFDSFEGARNNFHEYPSLAPKHFIFLGKSMNTIDEQLRTPNSKFKMMYVFQKFSPHFVARTFRKMIRLIHRM